MPHLSQLARDYRDQDVTVIGLSSEDPRNTLAKVRAMVADKGDGMDYTVAWDDGRATNEAFMKAAGIGGIPTCFVVDKAGKVAWIGHPMQADMPLAEIVAGTWDYVKGPERMQEYARRRSEIFEASRAEPAKALELLTALEKEAPLAARGLETLHFALLSALPERTEEAAALGGKLVDEAVAAGNSGTLNDIAWGLVDPEVKLADRQLDLALRAAEQADRLTGGENAPILDTLARVHFWRGDLGKAVELQRKAVEHATGSMQASLEGALKEYEAALEAAGAR